VSLLDGPPERSDNFFVGLHQIGSFSPAQAWVVRDVCEKEPCALLNLAPVAEPDVIDAPERSQDCQLHVQFLQKFPPDSLLRSFSFFDTAARRAVQKRAGSRVNELGHKE